MSTSRMESPSKEREGGGEEEGDKGEGGRRRRRKKRGKKEGGSGGEGLFQVLVEFVRELSCGIKICEEEKKGRRG